MKRLSEGICPGLITACFIMLLMGLPGSYFPTVVSFWDWLGPDKIIHLLLFAALSFVSLWGYRYKLQAGDKRYRQRLLLCAVLLTVAYGALTEILQKYLFINRFGSVFDFLADTIGCLLGVLLFCIYFRKKCKKK